MDAKTHLQGLKPRTEAFYEATGAADADETSRTLPHIQALLARRVLMKQRPLPSRLTSVWLKWLTPPRSVRDTVPTVLVVAVRVPNPACICGRDGWTRTTTTTRTVGTRPKRAAQPHNQQKSTASKNNHGSARTSGEKGIFSIHPGCGAPPRAASSCSCDDLRAFKGAAPTLHEKPRRCLLL